LPNFRVRQTQQQGNGIQHRWIQSLAVPALPRHRHEGGQVSDAAQIRIFDALDWIRDNAPKYAKAKAERVYLEEYRKTKKAMLMQKAEQSGHKAAVTQEREAYADADYRQHLLALQAAVEEEERLRWLMVAAQARIEAWRSLESSRRVEAKTL
jgi:hypothetical protein